MGWRGLCSVLLMVGGGMRMLAGEYGGRAGSTSTFERNIFHRAHDMQKAGSLMMSRPTISPPRFWPQSADERRQSSSRLRSRDKAFHQVTQLPRARDRRLDKDLQVSRSAAVITKSQNQPAKKHGRVLGFKKGWGSGPRGWGSAKARTFPNSGQVRRRCEFG